MTSTEELAKLMKKKKLFQYNTEVRLTSIYSPISVTKKTTKNYKSRKNIKNQNYFVD